MLLDQNLSHGESSVAKIGDNYIHTVGYQLLHISKIFQRATPMGCKIWLITSKNQRKMFLINLGAEG